LTVLVLLFEVQPVTEVVPKANSKCKQGGLQGILCRELVVTVKEPAKW
jgi:hypothetical protein